MKQINLISILIVSFMISKVAVAQTELPELPNPPLSLEAYTIFSDTKVKVGGNSQVIGLVGASHIYPADKAIGIAGGASVVGTVHSGGNVAMKHGTEITGILYRKTGTVLTKPGTASIGGDALVNFPSFPELPVPVFDMSSYSSTNDINTDTNGATLVLEPGEYGDVSTGGGAKLHLKSGDYFFESLQAANGAKMYIDLREGSGKLRLFSKNRVSFGGLDIFFGYIDSNGQFVPGPGDANGVYFEIHESVVDFGFKGGSGSDLFGTFYTVNTGMIVGNNTNLEGHFFSKGVVDLQHGLDVGPEEETCVELCVPIEKVEMCKPDNLTI